MARCECLAVLPAPLLRGCGLRFAGVGREVGPLAAPCVFALGERVRALVRVRLWVARCAACWVRPSEAYCEFVQ